MSGELVDLSRRFLDVLGADGVGDEYEQKDHAVGGREPRWVLMPATVAECAAVLRLCAENGLAVVPCGLRRRLAQGRPPGRLDVVLSTSRLSRIVEHAAADLTATVGAGAPLSAVNAALGAAGQWLPFDPPSPDATTIGGLLAAHASGPLRQGFGTVRESLIGLRAVLADGTVVKSGGRVVKNVAGYDVHRLLVGSFGTLAVIVEASFQCRPLPETTGLAAWSGPLGNLAGFAARLAASPLAPRLLEILLGDDGSPELVAGFAGVPELVADSVTRARSLAPSGLVDLEIDEATLARRLEDVAAPPPAESGTLVVRGGVPPRALGKWIAWTAGRLAGEKLAFRGHLHACVGVLRLRIEAAGARWAKAAVAGLRVNAIREGGYLVVESAPETWGLDPWGPPPAGFEAMKRMKHAFDPRGLLSPGRFVGGI